MSKHVLVAAADGSEDIELTSITDILTRGDVKVTVASVMAKKEITLAHGLKLTCDSLINDESADKYAAVLLPGGMPGAEHLGKSEALKKFMHDMRSQNKLFGAICASPVVALGPLGMLDGVNNATCYPGFESKFPSHVTFSPKSVVKCGNCLTSRGPGTAMFFALAAVALLRSRDVAKEVAQNLLLGSCAELEHVFSL